MYTTHTAHDVTIFTTHKRTHDEVLLSLIVAPVKIPHVTEKPETKIVMSSVEYKSYLSGYLRKN